jgi:ribosomal protein L19
MIFNPLQKFIEKKKFIQFRNNLRRKVKGFRNHTFFLVGDVVKVSFFKSIHPLVFEGICISLKKRGFATSGVSFILRNVILGVAIEVRILYFLNRQYVLTFSDFKRKFDSLNKNKLLEIRFGLNRKSKIWL